MTVFREGVQNAGVSPLRFASVEMTAAGGGVGEVGPSTALRLGWDEVFREGVRNAGVSAALRFG